MFTIEANNMSAMYPVILQHIRLYGHKVTTRGNTVMEVENMAFTLQDPLRCIPLQKARKFNSAYAVIEMLSLFLPGASVVEELLFYNPNMESYINPETRLFDGSYAERLTMYEQLLYCKKVLEEDPNSRRAVLDFYNAAHDQHESKDIACTLNLLFRIRDGKLNVTVFMRGNDVLWGTPYNFTMFTFLQNVMAKWLGVQIGTYTHVVGSAHYYEDKAPEVMEVMKFPNVLRKGHPLERMPEWDVEDANLTFASIEDFFTMSEAYHADADRNEIVDSAMLGQGSAMLKYLWDKVCKPYCDKKMNKLA